jgi:hypothetical protein
LDCCAFSGFEPSSEKWNDRLDLYVGSHGASQTSVAGAQVILFNINLSSLENNITYGGWRSLLVFFQQPAYRFSELCAESCSIANLSGNISFSVELAPNSNLKIDGIKYTVIRSFLLRRPAIEFLNQTVSINFVNASGGIIGSPAFSSRGDRLDVRYVSVPEGSPETGSELSISGLSGIPSSLGVYLLDDSRLSTSFFVFNDSIAFDSINFSLPLRKPGETLLMCNSFNYKTLHCDDWALSKIPIVIKNGTAYFTAEKEGIYAVSS